VTRPRVLLLDEPFSSLDPAVRQMLQEAVRRIQRELEITAVLVTHDRAEALAMADRVALIERGALVAHETPRRLYERPPSQRAARQMGVETFLCGMVEGMTLQSQLGTLALAARHAEGSALFAIRPEHLRMLDQPAENTLAALVVAQSFRGEHIEYQLTAQGQRLRVRASPPCERAVGEHVYLQIPPEHLFPVVADE
jgi:putative spermidine/putrescine transport system ATP-binding protein